MRKNCIVLILSILLISILPGFAQDTLVSSENETAGVMVDAAANATVNATANATANVAAPFETVESTDRLSLQGIWKISLGGSDIIMAVNQSGDSLFGQAKFEGVEPWNGVIAGSLSGRAVHIALAALQGKVLVSTQMSGTVQDDSIEGSYVRSNSNGDAAKGEFTAARISPDAAEYSPVQVIAAPETVPAEPEAQPDIEPEPAVQAKSRPFKDVRDLAKGIDPNIMPRHAPL